MTRTYGELRHGANVHGDPIWGIRAEPHVLIKVKRIFPRCEQWRSGDVYLKDTLEVARDLEWLTARYPLRMDDAAAAHLAARADRHRATEEAILDILGGRRDLGSGLREPAVPARPYQLQAADIVLATGRLLLADDIGLGKTASALFVLRDPEALPALVVAPTHLPWQWLAELQKFLPWLHGHVVAKGTPYNPATRRGAVGTPDVLIMGYSKLAGWADHLAGQVRTVIFDEIQELRRGEDSAKGRAAYRIAEKARYRVGLSATPVYNYGGEIHNIMLALDPDALGTRAEFLREWGGGEYGLARHAGVKDPAALGTYLRDQGLMLRRTRRDLHMEITEPVQVEQHVSTDHATIEQVAADIAHTARLVLDETAGRSERWHAAGEVDWRMRQATGVAKAPYVAEFVKLLLESEERVVLFGWHREVYSIWLDKLAAYSPVLYTGTESPQQKAANAAAFMGGLSRALIVSLRSGAGLDGLQRHASVCVFGELDWSPEMHKQAVGRLHRDGQESTVVAYFMLSDDGTDPHMAEVLGIKRQQAEPIRDPQLPLVSLAPATDRARRIAADILARVGKTGGSR